MLSTSVPFQQAVEQNNPTIYIMTYEYLFIYFLILLGSVEPMDK